jgi:hypothetical protein
MSQQPPKSSQSSKPVDKSQSRPVSVNPEIKQTTTAVTKPVDSLPAITEDADDVILTREIVLGSSFMH